MSFSWDHFQRVGVFLFLIVIVLVIVIDSQSLCGIKIKIRIRIKIWEENSSWGSVRLGDFAGDDIPSLFLHFQKKYILCIHDCKSV